VVVDARVNGETALHAAARGNHAEVITALISSGADINAAIGDSGGRSNLWTPLQLAAYHGCAEAVRALCTHGRMKATLQGAKLDEAPIMMACRRGHSNVVKVLLDHGVAVNGVPAQAPPLVCVAKALRNPNENSTSRQRLHETLDVLLRHNAINVNAQDPFDGKSALHWAVTCRDSAAVIALRGSRANSSIVAHDGSTPCSIARLLQQGPVRNEIVKFLEQ
jgi:ankyrin repeat protein